MVRTVQTLDGERERISLPEPIWTGRCRVSTGITLCALYRGPRTGRMFGEFDSLWQDRVHPGQAIGEYMRELDRSEFLEYCDQVDVDPKIEAMEI
jgi:hypothetical protein